MRLVHDDPRARLGRGSPRPPACRHPAARVERQLSHLPIRGASRVVETSAALRPAYGAGAAGCLPERLGMVPGACPRLRTCDGGRGELLENGKPVATLHRPRSVAVLGRRAEARAKLEEALEHHPDLAIEDTSATRVLTTRSASICRGREAPRLSDLRPAGGARTLRPFRAAARVRQVIGQIGDASTASRRCARSWPA